MKEYRQRKQSGEGRNESDRWEGSKWFKAKYSRIFPIIHIKNVNQCDLIDIADDSLFLHVCVQYEVGL